MTFKEIEDKVRTYKWLQGIAKDYQSMLEKIVTNEDCFTVEGILYSNCGDTQQFNLNTHRSIPVRYIKEGLKDILDSIRREMAEIEKELAIEEDGV